MSSSPSSRPPLLCEIKPTTSGIIQDPGTGKRLVAASKRPDGTLRKEIRIRPGYTPQEDVSKYRSARQQQYHESERPKGSVIGLVRPTAQTTLSIRGMSDAQKKNAKRKEKRHASTIEPRSAGSDGTPDDWDIIAVEVEKMVDKSLQRKQSAKRDNNVSRPVKRSDKSTSSASTEASSVAPSNPGSTLFKTALKSSSANPQVSAVQQLVPPAAPFDSQSVEPLKARVSKNETEDRGAKIFEAALQNLALEASPDANADPLEKKLRAMRKKLVQAEQLRERLSAGEELLPEQMDKISKIAEVRRQIEQMSA